MNRKRKRNRKKRRTETTRDRDRDDQEKERTPPKRTQDKNEFKTSRRGVLQLANWRNQIKLKDCESLESQVPAQMKIGHSKRHHHEMTRGHKQTDHRHGQNESWPAKNHVRDEETKTSYI